MLADIPLIQIQPETGEFFWLEDCEELLAHDWFRESDHKWREGPSITDYAHVPFARHPTPKDYREALYSGVASSSERKLYVLQELWWAANDPFRKGIPGATLPPDFFDILLQLSALLSPDDPEERLMAAEVARQMGDFSTAIKLLDFEFSSGYIHAANYIRELAKLGDSMVWEIPESEC